MRRKNISAEEKARLDSRYKEMRNLQKLREAKRVLGHVERKLKVLKMMSFTAKGEMEPEEKQIFEREKKKHETLISHMEEQVLSIRSDIKKLSSLVSPEASVASEADEDKTEPKKNAGRNTGCC